MDLNDFMVQVASVLYEAGYEGLINLEIANATSFSIESHDGEPDQIDYQPMFEISIGPLDDPFKVSNSSLELCLQGAVAWLTVGDIVLKGQSDG